MEFWIPSGCYRRDTFFSKTWPRRKWERSNPLRPWRFQIKGAYLPRGVIRAGETLRVRLEIKNEGRREGTIYVLVRVQSVYPPHSQFYCSDDFPSRKGNLASIEARDSHCIELQIPWAELVKGLPPGDSQETLAISIEISPPRRGRDKVGPHFNAAERDWTFQQVQLMHNPAVVREAPRATAFVSYAWQGRQGLKENEHRAWAYRFADSLSLVGIRPIIDYNFLSPSKITMDTIKREIENADRVIIVYSDSYLARMCDPHTGVGAEYEFLRSKPELWSKTLPIRRAVCKEVNRLFTIEDRFVFDYEAAALETKAQEVAAFMDL